MEYSDKTKRLADGGLGWGATNSGKSVGLGSHFARQLADTPRRGLLLGVNRRLLMLEVIPLIRSIAAHYGVRSSPFNQSSGTFTLGPSQVIVVAGAKTGDEDRLRTLHNIDVLMAEEVAAIPETVFDMAVSRMSPDPGPIFASCNPASPLNWVKQRLDAGRWRHAEQFFVGDNPQLTPEQVAAFEAQFSGVFKARMIDGEWASPEGLVLPHWQHCSDTSPATEPYVLGLDPAPVGGQCALKIVGREGYAAVVDEIFLPAGAMERTPADMLAGIIEQWGRPGLAVIDSAQSNVIHHAQHVLGWRVLRPVKLHDETYPALRLLLEQGDVRINAARCPNLVAGLYSLTYDDRGRIPLDAHPHAIDALRYASQFLPPSLPPEPEPTPWRFTDTWRQHFEQQQAKV